MQISQTVYKNVNRGWVELEISAWREDNRILLIIMNGDIFQKNTTVSFVISFF